MAPKVSVIMAVYNGEAYLREAVDSILNQTFTDFECLVLDDGSTDATPDILASYDDPRLIVHSRAHQGHTPSLNDGVRAASGKYVARMDADDVSRPRRLEAQVRELDRSPDTDLVGCYYEVIDPRREVIDRMLLPLDPLYRLWKLQFHNFYAHGSMMARKAAVLAQGCYGDEEIHCEDYRLWLRMSDSTNSAVIPEYLYQYRISDGILQVSTRHYELQTDNAAQISYDALMKYNPRLTEQACREIRAIYWSREHDSLTPSGIDALAAVLRGFCDAWCTSDKSRTHLLNRVALDALRAAAKSTEQPFGARAGMIGTLLKDSPVGVALALVRALPYLVKNFLR